MLHLNYKMWCHDKDKKVVNIMNNLMENNVLTFRNNENVVRLNDYARVSIPNDIVVRSVRDDKNVGVAITFSRQSMNKRFEVSLMKVFMDMGEYRCFREFGIDFINDSLIPSTYAFGNFGSLRLERVIAEVKMTFNIKNLKYELIVSDVGFMKFLNVGIK